MTTSVFRGKRRLLNRDASEQPRSKHTLQELHDVFITSKRAEGLRERTVKDHIRHFRYLRTWLHSKGFTEFLNGDLDVQVLRQYVDYMRSELKVAPTTVNVRLRTLKCFLKFANDEGYIPSNMASKLKLMKTDKDTVKIISTDQVQALLKVIDTKSYTGFRDYCLIMLLLDTGMRIQEATSLTASMFDFRTNTVYLQASTVKTRVGREVPLTPKVCKLLNGLVTENKKAFGVDGLFLSVYGTPMLKTSFRKRLVEYKLKAGIDGCRVSPHTFRHYFAKNFILNGGDSFSLQRILGVSSLQVVRKYINMQPFDVKLQHNELSGGDIYSLQDLLFHKNIGTTELYISKNTERVKRAHIRYSPINQLV